MTTDVMDWLRDVRKLDGAVLDHMAIKATDHPQMGPAVAFPYRRAGESYAAKFRTVGKDFRSTAGVSRGLYNEDTLSQGHDLPIVITEGEIDCLSVMQAGFVRAVSVPDGWTVDGEKNSSLVDQADRLAQAPFVVVAADSDEAGQSLPKVVANILPGTDVRFAVWPEGCKDANDVLVQLGEGALAECINAAKRIDPPGGFITAISDMPPMPERRVLRVGEAPFDYAVALELGAMSVWTGIPGSGKSTFLTWVAERVTLSNSVRAGILAFETHPHTIRDQLTRIRTGRAFADIDDATRGKVLASLDQRFRIVHRSFDGPGHQLGWLEQMVRTLAVRDNCKLIIVDPWNELEHLPEPGESMTNYINFALQRIRQMAEQYEVHIALVAHPKKINSEGKPRAPTGYDVADSAAFFNKPSLGVTVHQVETVDGDEYVSLNVWKVRNTLLYGFQKGSVKCDFDAQRQSYRKRQPAPSEAAS